MSTATNLLSLLNQLQVMENSLTNFMLETILKIQSLTETKVFLLLESTGGSDNARRFCGTRELVESFESGELRFKSSDVEVTLDPTVASVVLEKPRVVVPDPPPPRVFGRKKRGVDNGVEDHSDSTNGAPIIKRPHLANDEEEEVSAQAFTSGEIVGAAVAVDVKREIVEFVIGDSDDEEEQSSICHIRRNSSISNSFIQRSSWPEGTNSIDDGFDANQFRPSNELSVRKLDALQSIENPTAVFEKGTLENKLLSSILYDYGKELAYKCPYEDVTLASAEVKSYFYGNLEQFLSHFQRFTMEKNIVSELLKTQSPQSYMRNIARSGYKAAAKNAMKRRGGSSITDGN